MNPAVIIPQGRDSTVGLESSRGGGGEGGSDELDERAGAGRWRRAVLPGKLIEDPVLVERSAPKTLRGTEVLSISFPGFPRRDGVGGEREGRTSK